MRLWYASLKVLNALQQCSPARMVSKPHRSFAEYVERLVGLQSLTQLTLAHATRGILGGMSNFGLMTTNPIVLIPGPMPAVHDAARLSMTRRCVIIRCVSDHCPSSLYAQILPPDPSPESRSEGTGMVSPAASPDSQCHCQRAARTLVGNPPNRTYLRRSWINVTQCRIR
jgi:hypothetical protein